jgi:hypothetical protein
LHYRWIKGELSAVDQIELPVKSSRVPAVSTQVLQTRGAWSPLSYELVSDQGAVLHSEFLQDPGEKRVEWQEPGEDQLRSQSKRLDTSDVFVKANHPLAARIRFYRHLSPPSDFLPKLAQAKSRIAEFSLGTDAKPVSPVRAGVGELITLRETGPRARRVNVAVVGDGYTASQKALFQQHLQTFANAVVSQDPPFMHYRDYFNIYGIFVASNESGADNPSQGITRDTYFDARYDATITRLLVISTSKALAVIREHVPEYDLTFAIVNSSTYGGSGGTVAVANYATPEIISHEVGHGFARLADEYEYAGSTPFEAPNSTRTATRSQIRWNHWIDAATPVPTPETQTYANTIGFFEGANYNATGWFRPKQNCRMRTNGIQFCAVCAEAYIRTMYGKVSPIDSFVPNNAAPVAFAGKPVELSVIPMKPSSHSLKVEWTVDGALQAGITNGNFSQTLANGRHAVRARVLDTTAVVRKDTSGVLRDSVTWTVDVSGGSFIARPGAVSRALRLLEADGHGLRFLLPQAGWYRIRLFDAQGARMLDYRQIGARGLNVLPWEPPVAQKLIVARLEAGGLRTERKFLRLK